MRWWRGQDGGVRSAEATAWAVLLSLVAASVAPASDEIGAAVHRAVAAAVEPQAASQTAAERPQDGDGDIDGGGTQTSSQPVGMSARPAPERPAEGVLVAGPPGATVPAGGPAALEDPLRLGAEGAAEAFAPVLVSQAADGTAPDVVAQGAEAALRRYEVWFEQQFHRSPWAAQPLTIEEAGAAEGKLRELGLWTGDAEPQGGNGLPELLALTPGTEETLARITETGNLSSAIAPDKVLEAAGGLPLSFAAKALTDSVARARGAVVTGTPLSISLSAIRDAQFFEDPTTDVGARLLATVAAARAGNQLGRELDAAYDMGDFARFGSSRDLAAMWTAGQIFLGEEVAIPALRDAGVLPEAQRDQDGKPVFDDLGQWLGEYLPPAVNKGLGAVPLTVDALVDPSKTRAQAAWTAALTFGAPTAYSLLNDAVADPPPGQVGQVAANAGQNLTSEVDRLGEFWEQVSERPQTIDDPLVRLGAGLPVQLTLGAGALAHDVVEGLSQPQGLVPPGRQLETGIAGPEAQQEAARHLGLANDVIRSYGQTGEVVADGLEGTANQAQKLWNGTGQALSDANYGFWRGAEQAAGALYNLPGQAARVVQHDVPQAVGDAAQTFQQAGQEQWDTFNRTVVQPTQQAVGGTVDVLGQGLGIARDAVLDTVAPESGPCQRGMRCWGNGPAGIGTAGPKTVGSCQRGMSCWGTFAGTEVGPCQRGMSCWGTFAGTEVGPKIVGPKIVGPGGPYTHGEQNYLDAQNQVLRGAYGAAESIRRDPVGAAATVLDLMTPATQPAEPQSPGQRALDAAGNSVNRILENPIQGTGGVLRDGWNCVTNPGRCWNGPQSSLPTDTTLVASLPPDGIVSDLSPSITVDDTVDPVTPGLLADPLEVGVEDLPAPADELPMVELNRPVVDIPEPGTSVDLAIADDLALDTFTTDDLDLGLDLDLDTDAFSLGSASDFTLDATDLLLDGSGA